MLSIGGGDLVCAIACTAFGDGGAFSGSPAWAVTGLPHATVVEEPDVGRCPRVSTSAALRGMARVPAQRK